MANLPPVTERCNESMPTLSSKKQTRPPSSSGLSLSQETDFESNSLEPLPSVGKASYTHEAELAWSQRVLLGHMDEADKPAEKGLV